MDETKRFKPLWMIHNATYRKLNKGVYVRKMKLTFQKILKMLKLKK